MSVSHINNFFSEEDGGYIADIPDLDSCSAFGLTPEDALAEVERAKAASWMPRNVREGRSLRPVIGRLSIRWHGNPKRGQRGEGYRIK